MTKNVSFISQGREIVTTLDPKVTCSLVYSNRDINLKKKGLKAEEIKMMNL